MALTVGLDILENPKEEENPKIPKDRLSAKKALKNPYLQPAKQ